MYSRLLSIYWYTTSNLHPKPILGNTLRMSGADKKTFHHERCAGSLVKEDVFIDELAIAITAIARDLSNADIDAREVVADPRR